MSVEGPVLTAIVARMADAKLNLAAYGVAVALAMLIEAPVIHLLSTTVALARDAVAVAALRRFMIRVNSVVTGGMIFVSIPWIYSSVVYGILGLPQDVGALMYSGFLCMIPWPAAIGFRRYYQGLLIRNGQTRLVAYGTIVRLIAMLTAGIGLSTASDLPGVIVGTASLTIGVIAEAIATWFMAADVRKDNAATTEAPSPKDPEIAKFWAPLAATSIIGFAVTPMLAFFMSRAPESLVSLAVLPVVDSFVFFFRSFGFSYQEVGVALIGERQQNYAAVRRVGQWIAGITTATLCAIAFTPLLSLIYVSLFGLSEDLVETARIPTMILVVLPGIAVAYSLYRSVLITARQNVKVTISTVLEVGGIAGTMFVLVHTTALTGALAAAISMAVGRIASTLYLWTNTRAILRTNRQ